MKTTLIGISLALGLGVAVGVAQAPAAPSAPPAAAQAQPAPTEGAGGTPAPARVNINIGGPGGRAGARGAAAGRGGRGRPAFPQFTRQLASPEVIAAGKTVYTAQCTTCHAADLRGTDQGVNLLEAETDLLDQHGELISPVLHGETTVLGIHPAVPLTDEQITDVSEYIHSVQAQMEVQGRPPGDFTQPANLDLLVGNADAGKTYFDAHCASCHQGDPGNLAGIGSKYPEIRTLQNLWVEGSGGGGGFGGRRGGAGRGTVTVTLDNGQVITGSLLQEDEFIVVLREADGSRASFNRGYNVKNVVVNNPADAHKEMARGLDDTSMHDITAYLHTLTQ